MSWMVSHLATLVSRRPLRVPSVTSVGRSRRREVTGDGQDVRADLVALVASSEHDGSRFVGVALEDHVRRRA
jgi:hypothetical protein